MYDYYFVVVWWFLFFTLGIIFFPLTSIIFNTFFDRGYALSKIVSLVIISYLIFLFSSFRILPFHTPIILLVILLLLAINIYLLKQKNIISLRKLIPYMILEEILFLGALFFWSYVRGHEPSIHGLEKYMDFGFVNSVIRSTYFPPQDMWFANYSINYYYFGHLITALLTKISFLPSFITYNLMLSTIFAFCISAGFSLAANFIYHFNKSFKYILVGGLLTAFLLGLSGNLHTLYTFFTPYKNESPLPFFEYTCLKTEDKKCKEYGFKSTLKYSPETYPNSYWYPNATRFIHNTIHEFPIYSFVVADLHGHVLDIPFVLLTLALGFVIFTATRNLLPLLSFQSLLLAVMYMTNAWDGFIYLLLTVFILVLKYFKQKILPLAEDLKNTKNHVVSHFSRTSFFSVSGLSLAGYIACVMLMFIIFTLPFNINFKPFVSGIGILCSPSFLIEKAKLGPFLFEADHCQHSLWWQLLILYGFFYFFVFCFIYFLIRRFKEKFFSDFFIVLLILFSTLLIIIPEFIYAKDIYPAHYRANTMFKLVYQAFIMLTFVVGYSIVRIVDRGKGYILRLEYSVFIISTFILLSLVFRYPNFAISSYYGNILDNKNYKGLDGTAYLKTSHPDDYKAIAWINKNIKNQPVILEAQGDSYTDYERISANTGLPTVLGWAVHEWLWRGSYDIPSPRIEEVKTVYENPESSETKQILRKYNVKYIIVGNLEKEKYQGLDFEGIKKLGKIVFQEGNTSIIQL